MLSFGGVFKNNKLPDPLVQISPTSNNTPTLQLLEVLAADHRELHIYLGAGPARRNCLPQGWEPSQKKPASNDWLTLESNDEGFCCNSGHLNASPVSGLPVELTEVAAHCIAVQYLLPNPPSLTSSSVVPRILPNKLHVDQSPSQSLFPQRIHPKIEGTKGDPKRQPLTCGLWSRITLLAIRALAECQPLACHTEQLLNRTFTGNGIG